MADRRRASDRAKWPFAGPRVFLVGVCRCSLSTAFTVIRAFELTIHLRPPFSFSHSFFLRQLAHPQEPLVPSTSVSPRVFRAHTHTLSGYITCSCNAVKLSQKPFLVIPLNSPTWQPRKVRREDGVESGDQGGWRRLGCVKSAWGDEMRVECEQYHVYYCCCSFSMLGPSHRPIMIMGLRNELCMRFS